MQLPWAGQLRLTPSCHIAEDAINHKHAAAAVEAALEEAEDAGITIDIQDHVHGNGNGNAHSQAEAQTEQIGQRGGQDVYSQRLHSTSQPRLAK